ncbi:MAG: MFS transporter [Bacteroidetes bacterium]|nr:MFS transporter [Bacteroidota bacterium]MCL2302027.1 MFS transporter [Lentimicrobiaceae bacterium]
MTEKVIRSLRDTSYGRWVALILVSITMFFAYMFVDVLSPLKDLLETKRGWSSENFGTVGGSEFVLNVFIFFLIFAGIILDKIGIRKTALLAGFLMLVGAGIKFYGVSDYFSPESGLYQALNGFSLFGLIDPLPGSAVMACIGFAIFGCGVEMAGITVSKALVKWFRGKELALAMGLEMAIARLGVFAVFRLTPILADGQYISKPVAVCTLFLLIGFLSFLCYFFLDRKLDQQEQIEVAPEDEFKVRDLKAILTSRTFLIVAGLCVLYYSAIFPFQRFAADMLSSRLEISMRDASNLFSYFPIGAMVLTPLLGFFLDTRGKGATMLIIGALLMMSCHLIFALTPNFTYPIAICAIVILGISFSLVPAALWPSVPKLVDDKVLGSSYAVIFWIQNIGLLCVPIIIGGALDRANPGIGKNLSEIRIEMDAISSFQQELVDPDTYNVTTKDFGNTLRQDLSDLQLVYRNYEKRADRIAKIRGDIDQILANNDELTEQQMETIANLQASINRVEEIKGDTLYNYRNPMLIFASFGVIAFILGIWLKIEDRRRGLGLELPNRKKK